MLNLNTVGYICCAYKLIFFTVTPVPVAAADWMEGAPWDSKYQVPTTPYPTNVDFSFGDIFTGQVRQVLSVLFKTWNK
jgi:hypothetical protein